MFCVCFRLRFHFSLKNHSKAVFLGLFCFLKPSLKNLIIVSGSQTTLFSGAISQKHSHWDSVLRGEMTFAKSKQGIRPPTQPLLKKIGACDGVSLLHCLSVPLGGIEGVK
jgi:hypothetical protein